MSTSIGAMWYSVEKAFQAVLAGDAVRIDGKDWTVYAVGSNVVRVDIRVKQ